MQINSYVDDGDEDCSPLNVKLSVLEDGRRIQENSSVTAHEDGSVDEVVEVLEEVIPMRVAKRVSRKMVQVPVEERVECFSADGGVETKVKSLDRNLLELGRKPSTLEEVANDITALRRELGSANLRTMANRATGRSKTSFLSKAKARYNTDEPVPSEVVVEEQEIVQKAKSGEILSTGLAWAIFAAVAAIVTYMAL